jgi:signal transduction histidine kinase
VTDTGVGVPPEAGPRVFEPFYTTKAKGTGLGLPICKWIVESHGGRISLESEPGKGTKVTIELPSQPS